MTSGVTSRDVTRESILLPPWLDNCVTILEAVFLTACWITIGISGLASGPDNHFILEILSSRVYRVLHFGNAIG